MLHVCFDSDDVILNFLAKEIINKSRAGGIASPSKILRGRDLDQVTFQHSKTQGKEIYLSCVYNFILVCHDQHIVTRFFYKVHV